MKLYSLVQVKATQQQQPNDTTFSNLIVKSMHQAGKAVIFHTLNNLLFGVGKNKYHILGIFYKYLFLLAHPNSGLKTSIPILIQNVAHVTQVAAGATFCAVLTEQNHVLVWGMLEQHAAPIIVPERVQLPNSDMFVERIFAAVASVLMQVNSRDKPVAESKMWAYGCDFGGSLFQDVAPESGKKMLLPVADAFPKNVAKMTATFMGNIVVTSDAKWYVVAGKSNANYEFAWTGPNMLVQEMQELSGIHPLSTLVCQAGFMYAVLHIVSVDNQMYQFPYMPKVMSIFDPSIIARSDDDGDAVSNMLRAFKVQLQSKYPVKYITYHDEHELCVVTTCGKLIRMEMDSYGSEDEGKLDASMSKNFAQEWLAEEEIPMPAPVEQVELGYALVRNFAFEMMQRTRDYPCDIVFLC